MSTHFISDMLFVCYEAESSPHCTSVNNRLSWAVKILNENGKNSAVCGNVCLVWVFFLLTVNNRSNVAAACSADKNYRKQHSWTSKCVTNTRERRRERGREMKEKERKRRPDKERENILPLCQYNIYANHAFSICVNFITHKGLIQLRGKKRGVPKPMTVKVIYSRAPVRYTTKQRGRSSNSCQKPTNV